MNKLDDALEIRSIQYWKDVEDFAKEKHKEQKYGNFEYMYHIAMVVSVVSSCVIKNTTRGNDLIAAAYCHDLIEDQGVTREEIAERFGEEVARLVKAVSAEGENRKERNQDTKEKLRVYPQAVDLKLADRYCNMKCAREDKLDKKIKMYASEIDGYKEFLDFASPKFKELFMSEVMEYEKLLNKRKMAP